MVEVNSGVRSKTDTDCVLRGTGGTWPLGSKEALPPGPGARVPWGQESEALGYMQGEEGRCAGPSGEAGPRGRGRPERADVWVPPLSESFVSSTDWGRGGIGGSCQGPDQRAKPPPRIQTGGMSAGSWFCGQGKGREATRKLGTAGSQRGLSWGQRGAGRVPEPGHPAAPEPGPILQDRERKGGQRQAPLGTQGGARPARRAPLPSEPAEPSPPPTAYQPAPPSPPSPVTGCWQA